MIMKLIMIDDLVTDGSSKTPDGIAGAVIVIHYSSEQPDAGTSHHSLSQKLESERSGACTVQGK